jgi:DNA-binding MurR/RpiR family transcriptional regulator
MAGLQSITKLAHLAGVSAPTIIRLARKLGFDGYPDMQATLHEEMADTIKKPALKQDARRISTDDAHVITKFSQAVVSNLNNTLDRLDRAVFDRTAALLADETKTIHFSGGRITRSNADYFFNHLQIIRPKVTLLSQSPNVWPQYLLDMDENAVLVIFDIRRYEKDLQKLATLAKDRGCTIVLFTDQWGSPISKVADLRFNTMVEAPSNWDSTLAIMFIVEALIAQIQAMRWDESHSRIEELEAMFNTTKVFRNFN